MAGTKNHDYHILEPDIWPLIGAFAALTFTTGMVFFMHEMNGWQIILGLGIAGLIATFFSWKMLRIILLLVILPMILGFLFSRLSQPVLRWVGYSLLVIPPSIAS